MYKPENQFFRITQRTTWIKIKMRSTCNYFRSSITWLAGRPVRMFPHHSPGGRSRHPDLWPDQFIPQWSARSYRTFLCSLCGSLYPGGLDLCNLYHSSRPVSCNTQTLYVLPGHGRYRMHVLALWNRPGRFHHHHTRASDRQSKFRGPARHVAQGSRSGPPSFQNWFSFAFFAALPYLLWVGLRETDLKSL